MNICFDLEFSVRNYGIRNKEKKAINRGRDSNESKTESNQATQG